MVEGVGAVEARALDEGLGLEGDEEGSVAEVEAGEEIVAEEGLEVVDKDKEADEGAPVWEAVLPITLSTDGRILILVVIRLS